MAEDSTSNQKNVSFRSNHAIRLVASAYPWWGFILIQAVILLFPQQNNFMHIVSMILAGISVFLMWSFGSLLSLRQKEEPSAYKSLSTQFYAMAVGGLVVLGLASAVGHDRLMETPNVFRNLIIMTGSQNGMRILWLLTCASIVAMGFIIRRHGQKGSQSFDCSSMM